MQRLKSWFQLVKKSAVAMSDDQTMMMGAALAYYTMFSIAPLLIIAIGIAGVVFGKKADTEVFRTIQGLVGPRGASAIQSMVSAAADQPHAGAISTAIGIVTLIVGASGVFSQLQQSLNIIWKVATSPKAGWWGLIRQRLLSFGMVAVMGFILLVSMLISAGLSAAGTWTAGALPGGKALWSVINFCVSLSIIGILFSAVLKYLPDVKLTWRDVSVGGLVTALLFVIGKAAIGAYLGSAAVMSSYGAAGSLIVVLLWTFYSSQILFFGAEFTRAYATRGGRKIDPKDGSVRMTTPFNAAAEAENDVEKGRRRPAREHAGAGGRSGFTDAPLRVPSDDSWYQAAAGSAGLALALLARGSRGPARLLLGGAAAGAALGMLAMLKIPDWLEASGPEEPREPEGPSLGERVLEKIPARVKVATVVGGVGGALKGGGKEAAREIGQKLRGES